MSALSKPLIYRSLVLDRTFRILDVLAEERTGLGVTELSSRLDLHKSTTHRLIMVLESTRYVEKDATTGRYRLGSRIIQLGLSAISQLDLYEVAKPSLRTLVEDSGETAHLGVLREGEITSVLTVESPRTLRTPSTIGRRHPAHSSSLGKAILAFGATEEVEAFFKVCDFERHTRNTITNPAALLKEIESIRRTGYAIDDEEQEDGLRCIGAPVRNSSGEVVAAVSIAGPAFRVSRERTPALAQAVMNAAHRISSALGYPDQMQDVSSNGPFRPTAALN